jgi:hypothetical protein
MAKRIIEISVNDEYVVGSGVVIGAAGADESVILQVEFNEIWDGLNIYATFRDAKGETPTVKMLMPSMLVVGELRKYQITVPAAATKYDGKMSLVFSGFAVSESYLYAKDGETVAQKLVYRDAVINTANAYFRVLPSAFSALDVVDQDEVTLLEQVLEEINDLGGEVADFDKTIAEYEANEAQRVANEEARSETVRFFENKGAIIVSEEEPDVSMAHVWIDPAFDEEEISLLDSTCITQELSDDTDKVPSVALLKQMAERSGGSADLGDVEKALDRIIEIQKTLIGVKEITFTIDEDGETYTCKTLKGMTWGEWLDSEYNTLGLQVNEWGAIRTNDGAKKLYYTDEYGDISDVSTLSPVEDGSDYELHEAG